MFAWLKRLLGHPGVKVTVEGRGYRVDQVYCDSQVELRRQLEQLGLSEAEILRTLRQVNEEKYGRPNR